MRWISSRSKSTELVEELSVKLLYLSGTFGSTGQRLLGGRQRLVQRDDQRVVAQNHGHGFGRIASPLLLVDADRLGDLLRHGWIKLFHETTPWVRANVAHGQT